MRPSKSLTFGVLLCLLLGAPGNAFSGFAQQDYDVIFTPDVLKVKGGQVAAVTFEVVGPSGILSGLIIDVNTAPVTVTVSADHGQVPFTGEMTVDVSQSATAGSYQITMQARIDYEGGSTEIKKPYLVEITRESGNGPQDQSPSVALDVQKSSEGILEIRTSVSPVIPGEPVRFRIFDSNNVQKDYFEVGPAADGTTFNFWSVSDQDKYLAGTYVVVAQYGSSQDQQTFQIDTPGTESPPPPPQAFDFIVSDMASHSFTSDIPGLVHAVNIFRTSGITQAVNVSCVVSSIDQPEAAGKISCTLDQLSSTITIVPDSTIRIDVAFPPDLVAGTYEVTIVATSEGLVRSNGFTITIEPAAAPGDTGPQGGTGNAGEPVKDLAPGDSTHEDGVSPGNGVQQSGTSDSSSGLPVVNLGATAFVTTELVTINWVDSEGQRYNIYRSSDQHSGFVRLNQDPVLGGTYTDSPITPGFDYYYYLAVLDGNGIESARSEIVSASAVVGPAPDTGLDDMNPSLDLDLNVGLLVVVISGIAVAVVVIILVLIKGRTAGSSTKADGQRHGGKLEVTPATPTPAVTTTTTTTTTTTVATPTPEFRNGEERTHDNDTDFRKPEEELQNCICTKKVDELPEIKLCATYPKNAKIWRGEPILAAAEGVDIHKFTLTCTHVCEKDGETTPPATETSKTTFPDALTFEWKIKEEKLFQTHSVALKYDRVDGWMYWTTEETPIQTKESDEKGFLMDADYFARGRYLKDRPLLGSGEQVMYVPPYSRLKSSRSDASRGRYCPACNSGGAKANLHIMQTYVLVTLSCKVTGARCGKTVEQDVAFKVTTLNPLQLSVERYGGCESIARPALEEDPAKEGECVPRFERKADPDFSVEPRVKDPVCYNASPLVVGVKGKDIDVLKYMCCDDEAETSVVDQLLGQWQSAQCKILCNGVPLNIAVQPEDSPLFNKANPHKPKAVKCETKDYPFAADAPKKSDILCSDEHPCSLVFYVSLSESSFPQGIATFGHGWIGIRHWYGDEVLFGYYLRPFALDGKSDETSGKGVLLTERRNSGELRRRYLISEAKCRKIRQMILDRYEKPGEYSAYSNNCVDFVKETASLAEIKKIAGIGSAEGIDTPGELMDGMWSENGGEIPVSD